MGQFVQIQTSSSCTAIFQQVDTSYYSTNTRIIGSNGCDLALGRAPLADVNIHKSNVAMPFRVQAMNIVVHIKPYYRFRVSHEKTGRGCAGWLQVTDPLKAQVPLITKRTVDENAWWDSRERTWPSPPQSDTTAG